VRRVALPAAPANPYAPDDGRYVTLEEYWAKWYEHPYPDIDVSYEWNNGILEAKPLPNASQLDLYNWFLDLLRRYLKTHGIAKLINLETGFVLTIADPAESSGERVQVRKPDIGLILNSNPVSWGEITQRHFGGVCDAVVEAVSDSTQAEVLRDTDEKRRDYALAGVKEYTILDPSGEHMRFYRLAPEGRYEEIPPDADGVIHSEVLPGFQFRMEDLRRQPELAELALDDVYAGFVLPGFRDAMTARRVAEDLAETEAAARRKAEERAQALEAELARLRGRSS
jgi:Uma2 family endonuclease